MKLSAKKLTTALSLALLSAGVSTQSQAAGFALIENNLRINQAVRGIRRIMG